MLERENLVPIDNPLQQLQLLGAEVLRYKDFLAEKAEELRSITYEDLSGHEDIRATLSAYERSLDRVQRVMSDMVRLGLDERLVRLSEAEAALLIEIVVAVLDSRELALSKEARMTGRSIPGPRGRNAVERTCRGNSVRVNPAALEAASPNRSITCRNPREASAV